MHPSRIAIIHGPNGYGKTIILTMIHSLFNGKFDVFYDVPFEELCIEFDNRETLLVSKTVKETHGPPRKDMESTHLKRGKQVFNISLTHFAKQNTRIVHSSSCCQNVIIGDELLNWSKRYLN